MKKFLSVVLLMVAFPAMGQTHTWFVKPPLWMKADVPKEVNCRDITKVNRQTPLFDCRVRGYDERLETNNPLKSYSPEVVTDGQQRWVEDNTTQVYVHCSDTVCEEYEYNTFLGYSDRERRIDVRANRGYYIVDMNDDVRAYAFGHGPNANTFVPFKVEGIQSVDLNGDDNYGSPSGTDNNISSLPTPMEVEDFWCNPRGEECSYTLNGKEQVHTRENLPNHLPMAKVSIENSGDHYCPMEECRNDSDDRFIGLNPFYYDNK